VRELLKALLLVGEREIDHDRVASYLQIDWSVNV